MRQVTVYLTLVASTMPKGALTAAEIAPTVDRRAYEPTVTEKQGLRDKILKISPL
jgi:hypothetical protein